MECACHNLDFLHIQSLFSRLDTIIAVRMVKMVQELFQLENPSLNSTTHPEGVSSIRSP